MSDTRVVAHFFVKSAEITGSADDGRPIGTAKLGAVVRGKLNKEWSHYTPFGNIDLGTLNPDAFAEFVEHMGQEYEVTFRPLHTQNGEPVE